MSARRDSEAEFVKGAETPKAQTAPSNIYPWDAPTVRHDVTKIFNIRLPEGYKLKLDYIARSGSHRSAHQYLLDVLLPAIDEEIGRLTKSEKQ